MVNNVIITPHPSASWICVPAKAWHKILLKAKAVRYPGCLGLGCDYLSLYHGFDGFVPCQREALFPGYIDKPCDYGSTVFHNPPCSRRTGMIMGVLFSIILPVRKPCDYGSTVFHNTPCSQTVCYPSPRAIFGGPPGILEALWHGVS